MSTETTDDTFEADLRTMLHRRAGDVVHRPVIEMPAGTARATMRRRGPALIAVAAGVVLLLGIGIAIIGPDGDDGSERVVATAPDDASTPDDTDASPTTDATTTEDESVADPATTTSGDATSRTVPAPSTAPTSPTGPGPGGGTGGTGEADPPTTGASEETPTVTIQGLPGERWVQRRCDGSTSTLNTGVVLRLDRSGPTSTPVTVRLAVSGRLARPAPTSFTIIAGESFGILQLTLPDRGAVDLRVDVGPGEGYVPGGAASWRHVEPDPPVRVDCLRPIATAPGSGATTQTIRVGERPADITFVHDLADLLTVSPAATLPPGLTQVPAAGPALRWGGAATTPGTFSFDVRVCHGPDLCDGTARLTITVIP